MRRDYKSPFLGFVIALLVFSCTGKYFKVSVKDKEAITRVKCVAIQPLFSLTKSFEGSDVITDLLSSAISAKSIFRVVPSMDVEKEIDSKKRAGIDTQRLCELGKKLNAEGIFAGNLTEYGYVMQASNFSEPRLGFSLTLLEIKGCKPIWSAVVSRTSAGSFRESLSSLAMTSVDEVVKKLSREVEGRVLDFAYRCGPQRLGEDSKCARGEGGFIDFERCPEAIPYLRLGREKVSLEGDEIIFNDRIDFVPGKSLILPASHSLLQELVKFLNRNNIRKIRIESYVLTSPDKNVSQAELDRAGAVRKFLIRSGLGKTQVDVVNFTIKPEFVKGKDVSNLRFVVLD